MSVLNNFAKIFTASIAVTAMHVFTVLPAQAEGIDWTSSIVQETRVDTNNFTRNNLPGVKKDGSSLRNQRVRCRERSGSGVEVGGSQYIGPDCNKKKPLFVIRENSVGGLLSVFPR